MGNDPTKWVFLMIFGLLVLLLIAAWFVNRSNESDVYPDYHPENYKGVTSESHGFEATDDAKVQRNV